MFLNSDGEVYIHNEGRRPLFLDGKAVVCGKQAKLSHQQMLEVCPGKATLSNTASGHVK